MKVIKSSVFDKWFDKLTNISVKISILRRLEKIEQENHLGDYKNIENGLYELRFFNRGGI